MNSYKEQEILMKIVFVVKENNNAQLSAKKGEDIQINE